MHFGTNFNSIVNINGKGAFCSSYNSFSPMFSGNTFSPGCFGYGYSSMCVNPMLFGAGAGVGYAAGMMLTSAMPSIIKGIGKGCSWLWQKAIVPGAKAIGNAVGSTANFIGTGIKNIWNKIFHKKN